MVLYAHEESFTLMTPQGHVFAGWITFSAIQRDGRTMAQAMGAPARGAKRAMRGEDAVA